MLLLTKSSVPILGQIATVMGWIMNGIYKGLEAIGIQNIGLCIVIFSIVIYALMTPLQIKQQKFSKLQTIMQPELQKINKKYRGKKDQVSMQRMQEETQAVYAKYGVSPTGSCLQMLIQMPILLSLWQVIYKIPGYVGGVKEVLVGAADKIISVNGYSELIQSFIADNKVTRVSLVMDKATNQATSNSIIDFLYALSPSQWKELAAVDQFSGFSDVINQTSKEISHMQNFMGLNIADNPWQIITTAFAAGAYLLVIGALLIPFLSWFTQMLNIKLMPQAAASADGEENPMMNFMKTMNTFMPLMSAFFCFTFPVGLGIYWISSAVVRSIQQVIINRQMNKIDVQDLVEANMKKMEAKRAKQGLPVQKITNQAHQNVRKFENEEKAGKKSGNTTERAQKVEEAYEKSRTAKPGSIAAKANMVRDFDERNKEKKAKK